MKGREADLLSSLLAGGPWVAFLGCMGEESVRTRFFLISVLSMQSQAGEELGHFQFPGSEIFLSNSYHLHTFRNY